MLQYSNTDAPISDALVYVGPDRRGRADHVSDVRRQFHFDVRPLDDDPRLLEESYRLRYQVYCVERRFLPAEAYPRQLEIDEFDRFSIHVGAVDGHGNLAGTGRIVKGSIAGLPLFRHCTIFPDETELFRPEYTVVEVSRLSVSRNYKPMGGRRFGDLQEAAGSRRGAAPHGGGQVVLMCLKALYQASKRANATHWLAATERSLQRLLAQFGFPVRMVGPQIDYFGPVAPYLVDLREFDRVIVSRRIPALATFLDGLEPEFNPLNQMVIA